MDAGYYPRRNRGSEKTEVLNTGHSKKYIYSGVLVVLLVGLAAAVWIQKGDLLYTVQNFWPMLLAAVLLLCGLAFAVSAAAERRGGDDGEGTEEKRRTGKKKAGKSDIGKTRTEDWRQIQNVRGMRLYAGQMIFWDGRENRRQEKNSHTRMP